MTGRGSSRPRLAGRQQTRPAQLLDDRLQSERAELVHHGGERLLDGSDDGTEVEGRKEIVQRSKRLFQLGLEHARVERFELVEKRVVDAIERGEEREGTGGFDGLLGLGDGRPFGRPGGQQHFQLAIDRLETGDELGRWCGLGGGGVELGLRLGERGDGRPSAGSCSGLRAVTEAETEAPTGPAAWNDRELIVRTFDVGQETAEVELVQPSALGGVGLLDPLKGRPGIERSREFANRCESGAEPRGLGGSRALTGAEIRSKTSADRRQ